MEACEQHLRLWIDLIGHIGSIGRYRFRTEYWQTLSLNTFPQSKWCQKAYHNHMHVLTEPFWASVHTKREGEGEGKLCYQSWASKTIGDISWVICDPAFFILQRAAVYRGGFEDRGEMESDFSDKCWHRACLILESEKILIRCVFENSSDDLRSANWLAAAVFTLAGLTLDARPATADLWTVWTWYFIMCLFAPSRCVYMWMSLFHRLRQKGLGGPRF